MSTAEVDTADLGSFHGLRVGSATEDGIVAIGKSVNEFVEESLRASVDNLFA